MTWPFQDATNTAVFTSRRIVDGEAWVYYVTHDEDDGSWQFHPHSGPTSEAEACVVGLGSMLNLEPRIAELADLPLGWHAWRKTPDGPCQRAPHEK